MKAYQWIVRDNQVLAPFQSFILTEDWYTNKDAVRRSYPAPYFTVVDAYGPSVIDGEILPDIFRELTKHERQ